jgi:hypothetical protein
MKLLERGSKGPLVKEAQHRLKHNSFGSFDAGPEDGQFGVRTGSACSEAKWEIGYRKGQCDPVCGEKLLGLLRGTRKPSAAMRVRRRVRRRREAAVPLRMKAFAEAKKDVGYREGYGNATKFCSWWGVRTAYCVIAQMYWYVHAGSKTAAKMKGTLAGCNVDALLSAAKRNQWGLRLVATPQTGDIGVIDFDGHTDPNHALMFVRFLAGGMVETLEANTLIGGGGEGVGYKKRPRRNCWFIRVPK